MAKVNLTNNYSNWFGSQNSLRSQFISAAVLYRVINGFVGRARNSNASKGYDSRTGSTERAACEDFSSGNCFSNGDNGATDRDSSGTCKGISQF